MSLQMDLDPAGHSWNCFLPQLFEDHFTVKFQGRPAICIYSQTAVHVFTF